MAQTFTPGTPGTSSAAVSATMRDNFAALASSHLGSSIPAYAVEGMMWYDSAVKRVKKISPKGSKAFGEYLMGAYIRLAISLPGSGQDGSLINADVRLQDSTLLVPNYLWSLVAGTLKVYFKSGTTPAYFAAQKWNDPVIDEPILWSNDGLLTGKNWETIVLPAHENVYTAPSSPLSNVAPFATTTLRGVEIEEAGRVIKHQIVLAPSASVDHVVFSLPMSWWENEDDMDVAFFEDGVEQDPASYKFRAFQWGGSINGVLYRIDPLSQTLVLFNTTTRKNLVIRKNP